eukprot:11529700-Alexandrium_andersonii.AAC.1
MPAPATVSRLAPWRSCSGPSDGSGTSAREPGRCAGLAGRVGPYESCCARLPCPFDGGSVAVEVVA